MRDLGDVLISRYRDSFDSSSRNGDRSLRSVLDSIQDGWYRPDILRVRDLLARAGPAAYGHAKAHLPAVTFGGAFFPSRARANLTEHSGLVHGDLDHLDDVAAVKQRLASDPYTVYCFISPSGTGLKMGVRIEPVADDTAYKHAWQAVADYYQQQYGITWDPTGKDISRLCYMSWDPDLYVNWHAQRFPVPPSAPRPTPQVPPHRVPFDIPRDRREHYAQRAIETAVAMIDASSPGNRHHARVRAAYLLGGYVGGGILQDEEAYTALAPAVARHTAHLERSLKTIEDGLRDGQARPITLEALEAERQHWLAQHGSHNSGERDSRRPLLGVRYVRQGVPHG